MDCCKTDILLEVSFCYIKKIVWEVLCARIEPCKSSPRKKLIVCNDTFHTPNIIVEEESDIFPKELCS